MKNLYYILMFALCFPVGELSAQISSKSLISTTQETLVVFAVNTKTKEIIPVYKFEDYQKNPSLLNTRLSNIDYHLGVVQGKFTLNDGVVKPYLNSDVKVYLGKKFLPGDMFTENDFYRHNNAFSVGATYVVGTRKEKVLEASGKRFFSL